MGATIFPGGFVRKSGDTMTGNLNIGLNDLIMHDGATKGCILRGSDASDLLTVRNRTDTGSGNIVGNELTLGDDILMQIGKTVDSVDISQMQQPSGHLHLGSPQNNIANITWTTVLLDTLRAGFTDGIENVGTHRITPAVAGLYLILGSIGWDSTIDNAVYYAGIRVNGVTVAQAVMPSNTGGELAVPVSCIYRLTNVNWVELAAYHNDGTANPDIPASDTMTFLELHRLRT